MFSFIQLFVVVLVLGLLMGLIEAFAPIPRPFKIVLYVISVLFVCALLLDFVGVLHLAAGPAHRGTLFQ